MLRLQELKGNGPNLLKSPNFGLSWIELDLRGHNTGTTSWGLLRLILTLDSYLTIP